MNRIEKLSAVMPTGADAMIVTSDVNRRYLTGLPSSAGTLLVTRTGAWFIIDFRYIEIARKTVKGAQVILQDDLYGQLTELIRKNGVRTVAVETNYMTVGSFNEFEKQLMNVEFLRSEEANNAILALRRRKEPVELETIKAAQAITDKTFTHMLEFLKPGITEKQAEFELEMFMKSNGADGLAFETIAVGGENGSRPHGVPGERKIQKGDLFTMDFGAMVDGYCSDMTRTVAIGKPCAEAEKIYEVTLRAQLAALEAVALGKSCRAIDKVARDMIYAAGYEGCFGHGLGHSVGMEIHENPRFSPSADSSLVCADGDIMTVEPGIYIEGRFGCRIEDMVYIGENGVEDLTHSPKELIIL